MRSFGLEVKRLVSEKIVFCRGGGCTAKLGAGILSHVLSKLPKAPYDENLLVGYDSKDDAAVYKISDEVALVQTLDFFPPMVAATTSLVFLAVKLVAHPVTSLLVLFGNV